MSPTRIAAGDVPGLLHPGMTVYVPGVSGESLAFYDALRGAPEAADGVRFVGVHFPGINRSDYLGLHPRARQRNYFMLPQLRGALQEGRAELLPLDYTGILQDLSGNVDIDLAIAQVSPPDAAGRCSLGPCCDFLPAVWQRARRRLLHVNPRLPRTRASFEVALGQADAFFEQDAGLVAQAPPSLDDPLSVSIARHVAALIGDGDTLQLGVGKLPGAILAQLHGHRRLRLCTGLVTPSASALIDAGATAGAGAVEAGVALGEVDFYQRLGRDDSFLFRPVAETHDIGRIAAIDGFRAINSAIEVDLFGQVNAESIGGRMVAGAGGLPPFSRGARLGHGGRSIIALPAAADDGARSRIVAQLAAGSIVTLPRHDVDCVVTEHGVANLRGLSLPQRGQALIAIAAPAFQEPLQQAWAQAMRAL
jgi:acyl-CoA hydrolase